MPLVKCAGVKIDSLELYRESFAYIKENQPCSIRIFNCYIKDKYKIKDHHKLYRIANFLIMKNLIKRQDKQLIIKTNKFII